MRSTSARAKRVVAVAAAALLAAFIAVPHQARAQEPTATPRTGGGKIGVATLGPPGLPADLRIKLEDAAAAGLRAAGAEVVSGSELSRARAASALGACTDAVCEQRLAQITETRYWLRGNIVLDTSTYRIHLELTDARTGSVLSARDDTCDICTEADAVEAVNMAASTLKAATKVNLTASPAAAAPAATTAATDLAPSAGSATPGAEGGPSMPASGGADQGSPGRPTWRRALPVVALVGAVGAFAAGAYYWSVDGDFVHCNKGVCPGVVDATAEKFIFTGAGVALAATAVVLFVLPNSAATASGEAHAQHPARPASVAQSLGVGISRHGIALSGRF